MASPIRLNGVPEMIIRSASRGELRSTSAPKRARSKRGVMLVIISTKQQERPKNIGQRLFLRPQLMASSREARMTLSGRASLIRRPPALAPMGTGTPVEAARFPQVDQAEKQHQDEERHLGEAGPAEPVVGHRPGDDEDHLDVEDDEEDRHQIERHRFAQARRAGRRRSPTRRPRPWPCCGCAGRSPRRGASAGRPGRRRSPYTVPATAGLRRMAGSRSAWSGRPGVFPARKVSRCSSLHKE